jgi:MOSC domain-containing protein YiiM
MDTAATTPRHLTRDEIAAAMPHILASPKDRGRLEMIVRRPAKRQREVLASTPISLAEGVPGDHWNHGSHVMTPDGRPHPDVQICMMNARILATIAGGRDRWPLAGDNLILDMDLSPDNLPPGTRLAIGSAVIEVTAEPHNGCNQFIELFGRDACVFVNTAEGKANRLRGIYARVVRDGTVSEGDDVVKLPPS